MKGIKKKKQIKTISPPKVVDPPKSALGALKIVYDESNAALEETQIRDLKIAMGCARF